MFKWKNINKPVYVLAPMANITSLPFRSICKEMGADIVYTPMFSSNAIVNNPTKTFRVSRFLAYEQPVIFQIFGYDANLISESANIVKEKLSPAGIDINLGCPAPKITGNDCGSALLKDLPKALKIIETIRKNYSGELSVKLRLGWNSFNILDFCKELESIGVNALAIHGRTAKQGYRGKANWDAINSIADKLNIPVIGNGDIDSWQEAIEKTNSSSLKGVMIGRATLGNPWIFKEINEQRSISIDKKELVKIIGLQLKRYIDFAGEKTAFLEMRKHMSWYIKHLNNAKIIRQKAVLINNYQDVLSVYKLIKNS